MKFCMVTTFYPPYHFGGDAVAVQRLARGLAAAGHEVTVVHDADAYSVLTKRPQKAASSESWDRGVRVVTLSSNAPLLSTLLTQQLGRPVFQRSRIESLLQDGQFDVVHFHNVSLMGAPEVLTFGGNALRLYTAHEHWLVCPTHVLWRHQRELCNGRECLRCVWHYRRPPQLWRNTGALEFATRSIDQFIALSDFSRDMHARFGFTRHMEVLPPFLPVADIHQSVASRHPRPYFLSVGRLERIKGIDDVLPVFKGPGDVDLLIIGDGDHADALRSQAAGNSRVHFLGRLDADAIASYYRHARALIVPSVCYETFGITVIEAFREGTPVIARELGPFPEIIEQSQAGRLFNDATTLRAAIHELSENDAIRDALSVAARRAFLERWSEPVAIPAYLSLVDRVMERRARARAS